MDNSRYYMRSKGKLFGPFDIDKLKRLAAKGMLTSADELSTDRERWTAAGKMGELFAPKKSALASPGAPAQATPRRNPPVPASRSAAAPAATVEEEEREIVPDQTAPIEYATPRQPQADPQVCRDFLANRNGAIKIQAIVVAILTFLSIHFPVFPPAGKMTGWWAASPGIAGQVYALVAIATLCALAMGIAVPLLKRQSQSNFSLVIGILGLVAISAVLYSPAADLDNIAGVAAAVTVTTFFPAVALALAAFSRAWSMNPGSRAGKPLFAVLAGLAIATPIIYFLLAIASTRSVAGAGAAAAPGLDFQGAIFVGLFFLSQGLLIASGVVGVISVARPSKNLLGATRLCAFLAVLCLLFAFLDVIVAGAIAYFAQVSQYGIPHFIGQPDPSKAVATIMFLTVLLRILIFFMFSPVAFYLWAQQTANLMYISPVVQNED